MLSVPPPLANSPPLPSYDNIHFFSTVTVINSAVERRDPRQVSALHAAALKTGLCSNTFFSNCLLDTYSKCGLHDLARKLFDRMPDRDVVSWASLISGYCSGGAAAEAVSAFLAMLSEVSAPLPNEFVLATLLRACVLLGDSALGEIVHGFIVASGFVQDPFVCNSLIDMYSKFGFSLQARDLVGQYRSRDLVAWTSLVSGCALNGMNEDALDILLEMLKLGIQPNAVTMQSAIRACSLMREPRLLCWIHSLVIKLGLKRNAFIVNSLIKMFCKNSYVDEGVKIYLWFYSLNQNRCSDSDVMAALLHGFAHASSLDRGRVFHGHLLRHGFTSSVTAVVSNSIMGLYAKHQRIGSARHVFDEMRDRDIVSWNTMISCLAKNGCSDEALELLAELVFENPSVLPLDSITMICSLQACSELASLRRGQELHGLSIKSGFSTDPFVANALIDMYSRSGGLKFAERVFARIKTKEISSWNSMISSYGIHGDGLSALKLFEDLQNPHGLQPNVITFSSVLSACSHSGLVMEGCETFDKMVKSYGINPSSEHLGSIVDLLCRAGKLEEAESMVECMAALSEQSSPEASAEMWVSLLGACGLRGEVEMAERAAVRLSVLEPRRRRNGAWEVALSNAYAIVGRWEEVGKVRTTMKQEGQWKEVAWSSVEVGSVRFTFMVGDTRHRQSGRIYEMVGWLINTIMVDSLFNPNHFD